MNEAVICIGSNVADKERITAHAVNILRTAFERDLRQSHSYINPSYNGIGDDYLNMVVCGSTALTAEDMIELCHRLETEAGRTPLSKTIGIMPLDLDIVIWNGTVIRPFDYASPHFMQGYMALY